MRLPTPNTKIKLSRSGAQVVGLDIQPGFIAAVQVRTNGCIAAERAAADVLPAEVVRDGEVADAGALSEALRKLFQGSGLARRVRVGIANQRCVLRILELPPLTDRKELGAAVTFMAQEQVPMPLNNAVLDFHPLGIVDTASGPRQRVVLVAAQRDMIERLLGALRGANLSPAGVDLSAFALIRSLFRPAEDGGGRVLYLNVDGLTNLAIAEGTECRFTRVVGGGLAGMAGDLAVRLGIPVTSAHGLLKGVDLRAPAESESDTRADAAPQEPAAQAHGAHAEEEPDDVHSAGSHSAEQHEARERAMSFSELTTLPGADAELPESAPAVAREVLEQGVREISGEVRNSLDFHRSQEGGGEVSHVVLSGGAQDIGGFAEALQQSLGVEVRGHSVELADERIGAAVSPHRLAVAAGLAVGEVRQ